MVLALNEDMLIWLRRIITDDDGEEALRFIREVLGPKIKEAERPSGIRRAFDVGGADGQVGGRR